MMQQALVDEVNSLIRDVPDFPKEGIVFKDITTVLANGPTLVRVIDYFKARYAGAGVDKVVGIESRGFIFGTAIAYALGLGTALVRKPGKLPYTTNRMEYELEYGKDAIEMHIDAIKPGEKVLIVDDLLATGGTAEAAAKLVEKGGGTVFECAFMIELGFLNGRKRLGNRPIHSLVVYE